MKILGDSNINCETSLYDAEYIATAIAELEEQRQRNEIEPHAYIIKKQSLVRLFLKATTTPQRKPRSYED